MKKNQVKLFPLAFLTGMALTAQAQNLIQNPDFSAGNTGFSTGYTFSSVSVVSEGTYVVGTNPHNHHSGAASFGDHTTGSGMMMIVNSSTTANVTVWQETVTVSLGSQYNFTGWGASWGQVNGTGVDPSPAQLQITVNGAALGPFTLPANDGQWLQMTGLWVADSTTAVIRVVDMNLAPLGNDFALDDMSFRAVPEPATMAALGLGVLALLKKRRR